MRILAFDTSSTICSVALLQKEKITTLHKLAPMLAARLILPMISELLTASSLKLNSLDAIAFGAGPGSFTGIRIASTVAQGLAYAENKPLIPISSLAAAAQAFHQKQAWTKFLVAFDARMEQVYWASYEAGTDKLVSLVGKEELNKPEYITIPEGNRWYGIGDAWDKYQEKLLKRLTFSPLAIVSTELPMAAAIAELAKAKLEQGDLEGPFNVNPVYLR